MRTWVIFLCFSTGLLAAPDPETEWRQFRGPSGQGLGAATGLATKPEVIWKTAVPGPGGSGPIVAAGRIYLTSYSGYAVPGGPPGELANLRRHLVCLDRSQGAKLWQKDVPAAQPEQDKVRDHGYASSTPAADADRVYVFFGKSGVFGFSHEGAQLWNVSVGTNVHGWGSAASPMLHGNLVIINAAVESESLVALDKRNGREVWRATGIKESWNTPVLVKPKEGKIELVVAIAGSVLGFDPATGEKLWTCQTGIGWYMVPSVVSHDGVVYCIGGRTGGSLAVRAGGRGDVTQSHRLWTLNKGSNVSSPLFHAGHLYFLHENLGIAYCVEAANGKLVYEERLPDVRQFYASPVLADGRWFAVDRRGALLVLAAAPSFQLISRQDISDRGSFDASPAFDGSRLLVRSDKHLYCLEFK